MQFENMTRKLPNTQGKPKPSDVDFFQFERKKKIFYVITVRETILFQNP